MKKNNPLIRALHAAARMTCATGKFLDRHRDTVFYGLLATGTSAYHNYAGPLGDGSLAALLGTITLWEMARSEDWHNIKPGIRHTGYELKKIPSDLDIKTIVNSFLITNTALGALTFSMASRAIPHTMFQGILTEPVKVVFSVTARTMWLMTALCIPLVGPDHVIKSYYRAWDNWPIKNKDSELIQSNRPAEGPTRRDHDAPRQ